MMKVARYILFTVLALLAAGIASVLLYAGYERRADAAFHRGIARTLTLRSEAFAAAEDIPAVYTCRGRGLSPQLTWDAAPAPTLSYAMIAVDWDVPSPNFRAASFTHWILYNIPPDLRHIDSSAGAGELHRLGIEPGENSDAARSYVPPCPPFGKHRYVFRIYALDVPKLQPAAFDRLALLAAMKGHILAYGELVGRFGR
jgi:Raf kinase inhibitor-like YbhB/YbcL family protein